MRIRTRTRKQQAFRGAFLAFSAVEFGCLSVAIALLAVPVQFAIVFTLSADRKQRMLCNRLYARLNTLISTSGCQELHQSFRQLRCRRGC